MNVYVVEKQGFVKVGVSFDVDTRISTYGEVIKYKIFKIEGNYLIEKARFIESGTMDKFNSETEFLYNANFDDVVSYVEYLLGVLPDKSFYFSPLNIELVYNNNGYIDLYNVVEFINNHRALRDKPLARLDKYIHNRSTKDFLSSTEKLLKITPIFGKKGKYGGTYVLPYVVLDFLCWADVELKIKVYEYMYCNIEYRDFINLCKNNNNEAFKISVNEVLNG